MNRAQEREGCDDDEGCDNHMKRKGVTVVKDVKVTIGLAVGP